MVKGDIILSPYTTWRVQLDIVNAGATFDMLTKYKDLKIDMLLQGNGKYLNPRRISPELRTLKVDQYYTVDETLKQIESIQNTWNEKMWKFENSI